MKDVRKVLTIFGSAKIAKIGTLLNRHCDYDKWQRDPRTHRFGTRRVEPGFLSGFFEKTISIEIHHMRRFTSTVPARGARAPNRAISNSCL